MDGSREERFEVDLPVQLSWQVGSNLRQAKAQCAELSASGARLEIAEPIPRGTNVLVHSQHFGRMGLASVQHCKREKMTYEIGLRFSIALHLGDPARRALLDALIRKPRPVETAPEPERVASQALAMKKGH